MSRRRVAKGRAARERRYESAVLRQMVFVSGQTFRQNPLRYHYAPAEDFLRRGDTLAMFEGLGEQA